MRFSSARLATAVALAGIVCLVTSTVSAANPAASQHKGGHDLQKDVSEKDSAQELWNNGHHHHRRKHHKNKHHHCNSHCKHHKNKHHCNHKPKHKDGKCPGKSLFSFSTNLTASNRIVSKPWIFCCSVSTTVSGWTIGLVCKGEIIDEIFCKNSVDLAFADVIAESSGGISKNRYVLMKPPCSRVLPPGCLPVAEDVSSEDVSSEDSDSDVYDDDATDATDAAKDDADTEANDNGDSEADAESPPAEMPDGLSEEEQSLWKKKHHHHHHRHHHCTPKCKHHHHNHNGNNGNNGGSHPFKDLCVDTGKFCGDQLFGCNFSKNKLYFCKEVGKPPVEIPDVNNKCSVVIPPGEPCVCPGFETKTVCGSQLPKACRADPNTIYYCPPIKGALPVPLER
ncbi:hypothetical protein BGZ73_008804, partial [Actinomortierella ambigua]